MSRRNVPRIVAVALVVAALLAAVPARSDAGSLSLGESQDLWSRVWDWLGGLWGHSSSQPTAVWKEDGTTSSSGESPDSGEAGTQSTPPDPDRGAGYDPEG